MNYSYRTATEILQIAASEELSIGEIALRAEIENSGEEREVVLNRMTDYYRRMKESVHRGLQIEERSQSGLSGGDARRVLGHSRGEKVSVFGEVFERSLSYGLAVLETNAAFGQIVATPTAGSAGITPACLLTWQDVRDASDEATALGLWTAAGIGQIIGSGACFSGAEGGCQAEIGSACSMAAAAICELDGGTPAGITGSNNSAKKHTGAYL